LIPSRPKRTSPECKSYMNRFKTGEWVDNLPLARREIFHRRGGN
jgi:hypothetical protein